MLKMWKKTPNSNSQCCSSTFLKYRAVNSSHLRPNVWQDSHTVIISSIKATDIVRKNFSTLHFLRDSHHSMQHLWHIHKPRVSQPPVGLTGTNPLSQYPKHREKIVRGSREGGFLFVFLLWTSNWICQTISRLSAQHENKEWFSFSFFDESWGVY